MKNPEFVSDFFVHSMRHTYEVKEIKVVFFTQGNFLPSSA